ncbi:BON domain-containing protein [Burkholderia perseverans]|uniref:BON domain-containing protein n=1 Tax=Burkholderia perseverans TaxID=2615214 RepID=UPI001FEFAEB1|nr:BON domain-containing protein [Burkholderia perseverans]
MKPLLNIAAAAACGAAAMYFLDPQAGRRRRAYVRDKAVEARHGVSEYASAGARRVAEQARGVAADLRAEWRDAGREAGHGGHGDHDADALDDARIVERIRAALALMASHPRDIEVGVEHGRAWLGGRIADDERRLVLDGVADVNGVRSVEDRFERREPDAGDDLLPGGGIGSAP